MLKWANKPVKVTLHKFPYSVEKLTIYGIVEPEKTQVAIIRNQQTKKYVHYDFWLMPHEGSLAKPYLIKWNELKNIITIEEDIIK